MTEQLIPIIDAVVAGKMDQVAPEVQKALDAGLSPEVIMNQGLIAAMTEVGTRFESGDFYVPEMLVSARAMESGLAVLKPLLLSNDVKAAGLALAGTVQGDLHDIGKNLVAMMLRGGGFDVIDLGTDVSPAAFVEAAKEHQPDIIAMSALLTTTMMSMKSTIAALNEAGIRDQLKVIIGGAPVTPEFADQIAADGFAPDAHAAVLLAKELLS